MKIIEVVAAIINHDNKILCVQRGASKFDYISEKWEFPGGKIESNETAEEALEREIHEELSLKISNVRFFTSVIHQYPDFKIKLDFFNCNVAHRELVLTEHIDFKWLSPKHLGTLDWAAADIPAVEKLDKM